MLTKILEMLKTRIKIIVIVSCVIIFAVAIFKKGITINNNNSNYAYQNQSQSQLVVSMMMQQGGFEWKIIESDDKNLINKLNNLEPYQSLFCKIIKRQMFNSYWSIIYPEIKTKNKN